MGGIRNLHIYCDLSRYCLKANLIICDIFCRIIIRMAELFLHEMLGEGSAEEKFPSLFTQYYIQVTFFRNIFNMNIKHYKVLLSKCN